MQTYSSWSIFMRKKCEVILSVVIFQFSSFCFRYFCPWRRATLEIVEGKYLQCRWVLRNRSHYVARGFSTTKYTHTSQRDIDERIVSVTPFTLSSVLLYIFSFLLLWDVQTISVKMSQPRSRNTPYPSVSRRNLVKLIYVKMFSR